MSEVEPVVMPAEEARERFARVGTAVSTARDDLTALYAGRAWLALGYGSWDEACDAMLGVRVALPREERRETVADLRGAGMSTRAIGSALGVSEGTVRNDLSTAQNYAVPERVVSLDGRERPASQPPRVVADPAQPRLGDRLPAPEVEGSYPSPASGGPPPAAMGHEQAVAELLADDTSVQDAAYRKAFADFLARLPSVTNFDVDRLADLIDDEHLWLVDQLAESVSAFAAALRVRRTRLQVITGGSQ